MLKKYIFSIVGISVCLWFLMDKFYLLGSEISFHSVETVSFLIMGISTLPFIGITIICFFAWLLSFYFKKICILKTVFLYLFFISFSIFFLVNISYMFFENSLIRNYDEFQHLLKHSTRYSQNFTEENFAKIKIGMDKAEVLNILGEPLEEALSENKDMTFLEYTLMKKNYKVEDKGYHARLVKLDKNNKVEKIIRRFAASSVNPFYAYS